MKAFKYATPAVVYFGEDCVKNNKEAITSAGKKALVITSQFSEGCINYGLQDMEEILKEAGITYKVVVDVEENPTVEQVARITEDARAFQPEFIVAIGGGSVIDCSKAVSCYLPYPDKDPYDHFFGKWVSYGSIVNETSIPVFSIPTTAGTGADVTGGAVLTRADTDTKLTTAQYLVSEASFLDPRYIKESPYFLLDTGAMDALAHAVETTINVNSNYLNRSIAAIALGLFAEFKDALEAKTLQGEDFDKMHLASTISGMAFMQAGTALPHGMSYPLSHHKGLNHGLGCAIFLGEYVRSIKDQSIVQPIVERCGFQTVDEFAEYVKKITNRNVDIEVTEEELNAWTDEFASLEYRLARHPEPIGRDEIYKIYHDSLEKYIVK